MMLTSINTNVLTVIGRFAACVNSRAADTFADNRVVRTGLALQVPPAWSSTAGAADAAHDTHEHHLHCNNSGTGGRGEPLALGISRFSVVVDNIDILAYCQCQCSVPIIVSSIEFRAVDRRTWLADAWDTLVVDNNCLALQVPYMT